MTIKKVIIISIELKHKDDFNLLEIYFSNGKIKSFELSKDSKGFYGEMSNKENTFIFSMQGYRNKKLNLD